MSTMTPLQQHQFSRNAKALRKRLASMVWYQYEQHSVLEAAFCALVLKLEPNCKVRRLYDALPYRCDVMMLVDLQNTMVNLGYGHYQIKGLLTQLDSRLLPCLFIADSDDQDLPAHAFIVLEKTATEITLFDCQNEEVTTSPLTSDHTAMADIKGTAYGFQPLHSEQQPTSQFMRKSTGFSWFRAVLSRFGGVFQQVLLVGLLLNILALATPVFIMVVYDRVVAAHAVDTLYYLLPGMLLALTFEWLLRSLRSKNLAWLAARLGSVVGNSVFARLIELPANFIEQASVSSQLARVRTFEYVRDFFSGPVFLSLLELPFIFLALLLIGGIAGPLVMVPLLLSAVYIVLFILMRRRIRVLIRLAAKASSMRQHFTVETFEKMEAIRGQGLEAVWLNKFRKLAGQEYWAHFQLTQLGFLAETLAHGLTILSAVAILSFGIERVWGGEMTPGALVASMMLSWRVLTPLYSLCSMIMRLEQLDNSVRQVNQLMDMETEVEQNKSRARLKQLKGRLNFTDVTLRYSEQSDPVFSHLNFRLVPGELLMLTGPSGSGKSSVLKLAQGLYLPTEGTVRVDGFDIRQLDQTELRRQIAYMPQTPDFFHGTIAENLQFIRPAAQELEMWEALRMSGLVSLINSLPAKLQTVIAMPGEEKLIPSWYFQLSLARMYLQNAHLVLIDELPNAVLSGPAGKLLHQYLKTSHGKRTIIMVNYREDFLQLADQVIRLEHQKLPNITALGVSPAVTKELEKDE